MSNPYSSVWCVIPVFNNGRSVRDVSERALKLGLNGVMVVDDGSTDIDVESELGDLNGVTVLKHKSNMGKGRALLTALHFLSEHNVDYMITVDGDGQHYPEDIEKFLPEISENDYTMVIGCRDFSSLNVPEKSRFGRSFSNFWAFVETGCKINDAQSGFRAYPVKYISRLHFLCSHYNFETEVLVKAVWAGIPVKNVNIRVWYPETPGKRVSSFKPFMDNLRITLINIHLVGLRILPFPRRKLLKTERLQDKIKRHFRNPLKLIRELLVEHSTTKGLAAAAGVGAFLAVLPIPGFHSIVILYAASRLHLNKVMAFNIQHFFMPPFVPFLSLEVGHYLLYGKWLTELTFDSVCCQLGSRILEWWIGSIILALPLALITSGLVYLCASIIRKCYNAKL